MTLAAAVKKWIADSVQAAGRQQVLQRHVCAPASTKASPLSVSENIN